VGTGWGEVYASQYNRLVVLVTAVSGSREQAEEAVQEAFVRALGLTGRRAVRDEPEAWLYRVSVNIVRSRWRRARAGRRAITRMVSSGGPEEPAQTQVDARLAVLAALRRVPWPQREALALHYFADMAVAEIAAWLDCPVGTVKSRLSRGRDALALLLADDSVEGADRGA
jgi:RNA polymerase sigma-70 factor (ECF subfamily)